MMSKNVYVDFHVLQSVPPACINRDDTGSPKTAFYGGTLRARVSSQAWKRAMRIMFRDIFEQDDLGYRTRKLVSLVAEEIRKLDDVIDDDEANKVASEILEMAGAKSGADKKEVLFFINSGQINAIAKIGVEYCHSDLAKRKKERQYKKLLESALKDNPGIDMLLFGRMAANNATLNYDAAAQVAHSISTHTIFNEYDYFTAVDDCAGEEETGARLLATVEYNSSVLYRYATVNARELLTHLRPDEVKKAVCGFSEAFIRSMPTGRQNTFANRTLPYMVYVALRCDQPINFSGAFERPIRLKDGGYLLESGEALVNYANSVYENYVNAPEKAWLIGGGEISNFGKRVNLKELLSDLETEMGNIENIIATV